MNVLFLFESNLPQSYHSQTLSPGELRVIASQSKVNKIIALGPAGKSFYETKIDKITKTKLERKIEIIRFNSIFPYYFRFIPLFFKAHQLIKKNKIDLLHAESPHISGIAAVILKKIFHIQIAIEYRASYDQIFRYRFKLIPTKIKSLLFWTVSTWVLKNADLILANSQTYANELKVRFSKANIHHYNPGVKLPNKLSDIKRENIIGFLGRLYVDKGAIYLLQASNLIKKELYAKKWKIEIAGEGPEKSKLQRYIDDHDLGDLIKLVGTKNRWDFLSRISIMVNTTIVQAALEMVNVEAGACKVPTICFGNENYPETVIDNITGLKVNNKDTKELSQKILYLINHPMISLRLAEEAYRLCLDKYSFSVQTLNLSRAYRSLTT